MARLALLSALLLGVVAGLAAGASDAEAGVAAACAGIQLHSWFHHPYEYIHLENWILVVLVAFAVIFESAWHNVVHLVKHADHDDHHAYDHHDMKQTVLLEARRLYREESKSLFRTVTERCSGELMILGVLAMIVWSCARGGAFYGIVCGLHDFRGITLPVDHHGYLETVEDVHMQLFLAMCTFIAILTVAVALASKTRKHWKEHERLLHQAAEQSEATSSQAWHDIAPQGLEKMFMNFAKSKRLLLQRLQDQALKAAADPGGRDDHVHYEVLCDLVEEIVHAEEPEHAFQTEQLAKVMEPWFRFDTVLGLHYHYVLEDMLEIKVFTWVYLATGLVISAFCLRVSHAYAAHWIIIALQILLAGAFGIGVPVYIHRQKKEDLVQNTIAAKKLRHELTGDHSHSTWEEQALHIPHLRVQHFPLFTMQIFIFYWCYTIMRLIASNYWWHNSWGTAVSAVVIWVISIPCMGVAVAKALQIMAMIMARGDMTIQKDHLSWIIALCERHLAWVRRQKYKAKRDERSKTASTAHM
mmetsp:Transcript_89300/g.247993  ORF Transcript_89300/g.247993 Transcript_89300/m.247993 type:complete len:528 (+) Transcript_89300:94-1677(+)